MSIFKKNQSHIPKRRQIDNVNNTTAKPTTNSDVFKRNRTLTGTTSNNLDSTGARTDLESSRIHAHRLSIQRRKIASILVMVFISFVGIWIFITHLTASVSVSVSDSAVSKPLTGLKYEQAIQEYLGVNPMERITFLLNQPALTSYVASKLPEVSKVTQTGANGIGRTNFEISMRDPVAGWQINSKQYYVDASGVPFEQNYYSAPAVQIIDNSGISIQTTDTTAIASQRFLGFVGRVVYLAHASGLSVIQASLPANTTRELEVKLKEGGYLVKLSIDRLAGEQVEDMVRAVRYFKDRAVVPAYIDVRVSGKAFFK